MKVKVNKSKQGEGLTLNTIIVAILVIVVLVVLVMIFTGQMNGFLVKLGLITACPNGGCQQSCGNGYMPTGKYCSGNLVCCQPLDISVK
jgi:hypothetical protein